MTYVHDYSRRLLDAMDTHIPVSELQDQDELTIRVWALIEFEKFINEVAWIEHTCDWDLTFEVTLPNGKTYFATDIEPLNSKDELYTKDNGVNDHITAIRLNEYWLNDGTGSYDPKTFQLSEIDSILFAR